MKAILIVAAIALALLMVVQEAQALPWWFSTKYGSHTTLHYQYLSDTNAWTNKDAGIAMFQGRIDHGNLNGTKDNKITWASTIYYRRVYCVDIFQSASSSSWAPPGYAATEWDVAVRTGVDGETGWITPPTDTDHYRAVGGLRKAAYVANKYRTWIDTAPSAQQYDRTIAVNTALHRLAYGNRLRFKNGVAGNYLSALATSGLTAAQQGYYTTIVNDVEFGYDSYAYTWFDNNDDDNDDTKQDFLGEIPEPGTLMLLGGALLAPALAALRRKRS